MSVIVGVVAKPQPSAKKLAESVLAWIKQRNIDFRLDSEVATALGMTGDFVLPRHKFTSECDIVVVLGGDGTMISVCRHASETPATIIGVNVGTLGFLTEITVEELIPTLEATLNGTVKKEARLLLAANVMRDGSSLNRFSAINDIVLTKEALARIFGVQLRVNGENAALIRGDGVVVSTPVGSTAYSMAAGGSIVHPLVGALLVTPICPHSLTSRPLVLPGSSTIELEVDSSAKDEEREVFLTIDGQEGMALIGGDRVIITTSNFRVYFVRSPSRNYFEVLGAKLKWANH